MEACFHTAVYVAVTVTSNCYASYNNTEDFWVQFQRNEMLLRSSSDSHHLLKIIVILPCILNYIAIDPRFFMFWNWSKK